MLRRWLPLALVALSLLLTAPAHASETAAEHAADLYATSELASHPLHANLPDYTLPAPALAKAVHLDALRTRLHLLGILWTPLAILILLATRLIARMRDLATTLSHRRWLQTYTFLLLYLATLTAINLPIAIYAHHVSTAYGLSIQHWPGWFADLAKGFALQWLIEGALAMLLFWTIGKFPHRWWLVFFAAAVPLTLLAVTLAPITVDPLFNHFEPLALHHPELSRQLEHMGVPADRQFLMRASAKVTTPNAYVTGLGPTARIVVWDTTLTPGQPITPSILWTVGHECGHYVLSHVLKGTLLSLAGVFLALYLCFVILRTLLTRFGPRWRIPSQHDLAALAVLLLAANLLTTLASPIANTVSRHIEHDADIYGEEAIHTLVPNPQTAVRTACDEMGQRSFDDPNPNPIVVRLFDNHPSTPYRAAFGYAYNPWSPTTQPKYFSR